MKINYLINLNTYLKGNIDKYLIELIIILIFLILVKLTLMIFLIKIHKVNK